MRTTNYMRTSLSVIFFIIILGSLFNRAYSAGTLTITRGAVSPTKQLNWSITNDSTGCVKTTTYPNSGDGIRIAWLNDTTNNTGYITINTVYEPGTWTFTCTSSFDSTILDTATLIVNDCPSGTTWNGSACVAPTPTPTASLSIAPLTCTIATNASTCSSTLQWAVDNTTGVLMKGTVQLDSMPSGGNRTRTETVTNGTHTYYVRDGSATGTSLAENTLTASCVTETTWDGTKCAPPSACGPGSSATPALSEPTSTSACSSGTLDSNSPTDTTTSGLQAWNWSCGTVNTCSAPKFGCRIVGDTNYTLPQYGANGPNNNYGCASTCANSATDYPSCSTYTITASSGANGSVTPAGVTIVPHGGSKTYTITPNAGYSVASIIADGVTRPAGTSATFSGVVANHTISATFIVTPCTNGAIDAPTCTTPPTISSFTNNGPIATGSRATLTWGAVTGGGTITCSIDNGVGSATPLGGGSRQTAVLSTNTTYTLTCSNAGGSATKQTTVTVMPAGICGSESSSTPLPSEPTTGAEACSLGVYTNSPADTVTSGSQAWNWTCNNSGVVSPTCTAPKYGCTTSTDLNYDATGPNNTYKCSNICTNSATNYPTCSTHTITASAGPNGSVTPAGVTIVPHGSNQDYSISADSGYYIFSTTVDGVTRRPLTLTSTRSTITFSGVDKDHTISASFIAIGATSPDLTAGPASPTTAVAGTPVTLTATISNVGNTSTGVGFNNFFQVATAVDGGGTITDLAPTAMGTLAARSNANVTTSYIFPSVGTYSIRVCADKKNRGDSGTIDEGVYENNNCSSAWTTVTVTAVTMNCTAQTLTWGSCSGSAVATNNGNMTNVSDATTPNTGSATYACNNGTFTLQAGSTCTPPPTATLTANPTSVISGNASRLSWTSNNATSCAINQGIGPVTPASGGNISTGNLTSSKDFALACSGPGGSVNAIATVTVTAATTVTVTADPSTYNTTPSAPVTFYYTSSASDGNETSCRLLDGNQNTITGYEYVDNSTSVTYNPSGNPGLYTYYIKCKANSDSTLTAVSNVISLGVCPAGKLWSSKSDQCTSRTLDLTAGSITPTTARALELATFSALISNTGSGSTETSFYNIIQYTSDNPYVDPNPNISDLGEKSMNALASGATDTTSNTKEFQTPGTYYMRACADKKNKGDAGTIDETDEGNNCGVWTAVCIGTSAQCPSSNPPQVIDPLVSGNNTPSGTLSFSCLNSTTYSITRTEGPSGIYPKTNIAYTGPVSSPVSVVGNYNLICSKDSQSDTVTLAYDPTTANASLSLVATPATTKSGTISTLSWIIGSPNNTCAITASAVYTTGDGSNAERDADAVNLTKLLKNPNKTDLNDSYGQRMMNTALRTSAPGVTGKAVGKKSLMFQYTTDFLLNCGGTATRKVRVQVTNENEG